ncbi:hypothetical protein EOT10_31060 [Streptomyces antnestii]|uniref:Uncharacterized protein n=1 Tax=Streptomyces antnestii TaxID=2494256 RepID=A0A3S2XNA9_9ACTN|nr:hypothetical protein EOT10_31060 [Streptomyces sp. San01]
MLTTFSSEGASKLFMRAGHETVTPGGMGRAIQDPIISDPGQLLLDSGPGVSFRPFTESVIDEPTQVNQTTFGAPGRSIQVQHRPWGPRCRQNQAPIIGAIEDDIVKREALFGVCADGVDDTVDNEVVSHMGSADPGSLEPNLSVDPATSTKVEAAADHGAAESKRTPYRASIELCSAADPSAEELHLTGHM